MQGGTAEGAARSSADVSSSVLLGQRQLVGENVFSSMQSTAFLIWNTTSLPLE